MRPIKIKELNIINRVGALATSPDAEEYTTALLLSLMIDCLSIDKRAIPATTVDKLMETFISYNFPEDKKEFEESERSVTKSSGEARPLSFYIDFLVNQGHTVSDIMEMTMIQFNELVLRAGERLNPEKKVLDPMVAFKKMGLPIRSRGKTNGR